MRALCLLLLALGPGLRAAEDAAAMKFFETEVRPLLANRCYDCHGEKKQKGSLRLDHPAEIQAGGDSGPALVPGKPEESLLIKGVRYTDPDFQMPPKKQLSAVELATLEKWVRMGAPWPASEAGAAARDEHGFTAAARGFWSFQPLGEAAPPDRPEDSWPRTGLDRFLAQKLEEQGLTPAPEASPSELLRRVYYDVTGLPPTREQAAAFLNSSDPLAYEKLVAELLASPRYGERWAQSWLDLVRYAESDGYNQDAFRPAAWPYRDWVISALNRDLPYDEFVREQLAGDELAPGDPTVLVATGYLRAPIYEWNQRDVRGQWDSILNDLTDNAGEVFLGLSYGCARCHDHKFDPILQKDYFRLKAFFTPVLWRDDLKLATAAETRTAAEKQAAWESATADVRAEMDAMVEKACAAKVRHAYDKFTDDLRAVVDKPAAERNCLERQLGLFCTRQMEVERVQFNAIAALPTPEQKTYYQALEAQLKTFDKLRPAPLPEAFVVTDAAAEAPPTVLKTRRGQSVVAPGFLTLLAPGEPAITPLPGSSGRRSALATWITSPGHPLTARVIVNRVWAGHFGRGLVGTPNDFGQLGERPSHPELLDWLARRFMAEGWSLKTLHREILLSAAYRQTARRETPEHAALVDPTNKLLWRFPPRRLDAEQVRDSMLLASGELDLKAGGPSGEGTGTRRSIYTAKKRNTPTELLRSLDAPAGFTSTPERQSTTTPTQALLLVNGEWPLVRAQKLAARSPTLEEAWQNALGRPPRAEEAAAARAFLERHTAPSTETTRPPLAPEQFHENTAQERLISRTIAEEGGEFTVEAIVRLESVDTKAAVRTIASRWSGAKDGAEGIGWSLGVTGEKSRFQPRNLILQLVGEDENQNLAYEVAASDLRLELGVRYHVAARVSCHEHTVTFTLQALDSPEAPVLIVTRVHPVRARLETSPSGLVIGGLHRRAPGHHWDGSIEAVRVVPALLADEALSTDPAKWTAEALVSWEARQGLGDRFDRSGNEPPLTKTAAPEAMTDLCHVLLNTNEFFYLH